MSLKLSAGCECCTDPEPDACICAYIQMVLIFQDEAMTIYSPSGTTVWDEDVADWEAAIALYGAPEYAQLCQVWQGGPDPVQPEEATSVCKPSTRDMPDGWTWDDLVRSPTEAQCKAVYDSAKGGAGVDDPTGLVLLGVDVSGSMDLFTLGQGYTDFKDYLDTIGVAWKQVLFGDERWVQLTTNNFTDTVTATPAEVDITLEGLENGADCDICENLVGDFTLIDPILVTDLSEDGWSLNGGRGESATDFWSQAADVPAGATSACVWNYKIPPSPYYSGVECEWYIDDIRDPSDSTRIWYRFIFYGYTLARFTISDTEYIWRLIVNFQLRLRCQDDSVPLDEAIVQDGWYWEYTNDNPSCTLTGEETWDAYFPDAVPLLEVNCYDMYEAEFSDWCEYDLTLTNIETVIP